MAFEILKWVRSIQHLPLLFVAVISSVDIFFFNKCNATTIFTLAGKHSKFIYCVLYDPAIWHRSDRILSMLNLSRVHFAHSHFWHSTVWFADNCNQYMPTTNTFPWWQNIRSRSASNIQVAYGFVCTCICVSCKCKLSMYCTFGRIMHEMKWDNNIKRRVAWHKDTDTTRVRIQLAYAYTDKVTSHYRRGELNDVVFCVWLCARVFRLTEQNTLIISLVSKLFFSDQFCLNRLSSI